MTFKDKLGVGSLLFGVFVFLLSLGFGAVGISQAESDVFPAGLVIASFLLFLVLASWVTALITFPVPRRYPAL